MKTRHGTIVDIAGTGVLLRGPSGSGKSDLALRLLDRGGTLVADDRYFLRSTRRGAVGFAPDNLYGLMEVRGLGVLSVPAIKTSLVGLVVDLVEQHAVPRLPEKRIFDLVGHSVAGLVLNAFEQSTVIKIELAVTDLNRIGQAGRSEGDNG